MPGLFLFAQHRRAQRDGDAAARTAQRAADNLAKAFGRGFQVFRAVQLQQGHELLAAEAEHLVVASHLEAQDGGQVGDGRIAGRMAVLVVHVLEMVKVQHDQAEAAFAALEPPHRVGQGAFHAAPVRHAGQCVDRGQTFQLHAVVLRAGREDQREHGDQAGADQHRGCMHAVVEEAGDQLHPHDQQRVADHRHPAMRDEEVGQQHQVGPGERRMAQQQAGTEGGGGVERRQHVAGTQAVAPAPGMDHRCRHRRHDGQVEPRLRPLAAPHPVDTERGDGRRRGEALQDDDVQAEVSAFRLHGQGRMRAMGIGVLAAQGKVRGQGCAAQCRRLPEVRE